MNRALLLFAPLLFSACHWHESPPLGNLEDEPVVEKAIRSDLPEEIPSYGISLGGGNFEVNVEASDSHLVKVGESARASVIPSKKTILCKVARFARDVSAETGQSLAWLKAKDSATVDRGEFIYASISVSLKRGVIVIPKQAVLVREGHTWVIRQEKESEGKFKYAAVPVETGIVSDNLIEIKSGLKDQDLVVTQGNIGFLYPDFKAAEEGD